MAFEETLVCDGCSRVIDGGHRDNTLESLRKEGGRAFYFCKYDAVQWKEASRDYSWRDTRRHLGGCCAKVAKFYDGVPVPSPVATPERQTDAPAQSEGGER